MRIALYCRISKDPQGREIGVRDQLRDLTKLASDLDATIVATLTDNDISASRFARKTRPAYRKLLELVGTGQVDMIAAQHEDRLIRRPSELEELIVLTDAHSVQIRTVLAGVLDLSTATGRVQARISGSIAAYFSDLQSEKLRARLQYRAADGHPHGAHTYGWTRSRSPEGDPVDIVNPDEAAVIRRAADTVLAGESIHELVRALIAEGIPSARGGIWTPAAVRSLVLRPRNAGLRTHQGKAVADGTWTPILERDVWERVCAILNDPTRNVSPGPEPAHLLSGIAVCAVCGSGLRALKVGKTPSYKCPQFHVSRNRSDTDRWVTANMLQVLLDPDAIHVLSPKPSGDPAAAAAEAETLRSRLDLAAMDYANGQLDARQLSIITAALRPQLEAAQAKVAATAAPPVFTGMTGLDANRLQAAWDLLPIKRRRAMVSAALDVRVHPAGRGGAPFNPEHVKVTLRTRN